MCQGMGLELVVEADADDIVRTAVDILACIRRAEIVLLLMCVITVECAEVADVQAKLVGDVPGASAANAIAVAGEGGVLLVAVRKTIVGTLTATADGELLVDVVLDTSEHLVCAVLELLLTVVGHLGVLVVEEMVFQRSTQLWGELIADSSHEE